VINRLPHESLQELAERGAKDGRDWLNRTATVDQVIYLRSINDEFTDEQLIERFRESGREWLAEQLEIENNSVFTEPYESWRYLLAFVGGANIALADRWTEEN